MEVGDVRKRLRDEYLVRRLLDSTEQLLRGAASRALALVAFELRSAEVTESFLTQALQRFSVQFVPRELQHEEYGSDCVQIVVLNLPAPPC